MSASVEDYDRISWCGLQILTETGKVQTLALRIPVPVVLWKQFDYMYDFYTPILIFFACSS